MHGRYDDLKIPKQNYGDILMVTSPVTEKPVMAGGAFSLLPEHKKNLLPSVYVFTHVSVVLHFISVKKLLYCGELISRLNWALCCEDWEFLTTCR